MKRFAILIAALFCLQSSVGLCSAHPAKGFLNLELMPQTAHNSSKSVEGEPFSAILPKPYCIDSSCIPAGTILSGTITKVHPSHRFHRPGYLTLEINKALFKDGSVMDLTSEAKRLTWRIYNPRSSKLPIVLLEDTPSTAADFWGTKALVELNETWHLKSAMFAVTSFGLDAVFCVGQELIFPEPDHKTIASRIAWGVIDTTGIPDVVNLLKKQPEASIQPGQSLALRMPLSTAKILMAHDVIPSNLAIETKPTVLIDPPEPEQDKDATISLEHLELLAEE